VASSNLMHFIVKYALEAFIFSIPSSLHYWIINFLGVFDELPFLVKTTLDM